MIGAVPLNFAMSIREEIGCTSVRYLRKELLSTSAVPAYSWSVRSCPDMNHVWVVLDSLELLRCRVSERLSSAMWCLVMYCCISSRLPAVLSPCVLNVANVKGTSGFIFAGCGS